MARLAGGFTGEFEGEAVNPPAAVIQPVFFDFELVEARLVEAFETLDKLPDRERRFLRTSTMAIWREARPEVGDYLETTPGRPGVFLVEHRAMMQALGWCEWLSGEDRRIVGRVIEMRRRRHGAVEWPLIRRDLGTQRTTEALRKAYGRALERICARLNRGR